MSLLTECILHQRKVEDGVRISVMSRHTLNDGMTSDLRITPDLFDEHLPQLGPPPNLIGDYYKRGLPWERFEPRYIQYLQNPDLSVIVRYLARRAYHQDITLLCIEETAERCHRRLLAQECQKYLPDLRVLNC